MLQTMRNLSKKTAFKALMGFLVISFAMWGVNDMFQGNFLQRNVATVGGQGINVQNLNQQFEESLALARRSVGPDLTAQSARQMGLLDTALQELVNKTAMFQMLNKLNIAIEPQTVLGLLGNQQQLQDKDGKLNTAMLQQLLAQQGSNLKNFIASNQRDIARETLMVAITANNNAPKTMADNLYQALTQKRIFDIVTIQNNALTIPAPDEKALLDDYTKNKELFFSPEYRALTIVQLSPSDFAKDTTISDADLQKAYQAKIASPAYAEKRDLLQIVVQDAVKAKKIASDAQSTHNLNAIAKDEKLDAVSLKDITADSVPAELKDKIFTMHEGEISHPIQSPLGWHIIQVQKINAPKKPDFASIKNELRTIAQKNMAVESVTKAVNALDDAIAAGKSLADIAKESNLRVTKIASIDATGKTPDKSAVPALPAMDNLVRMGFGQEAGETSSIINDKQGGYAVVHTDDITPRAPLAFEKARALVLAHWTRLQQADKAGTLAKAISNDLKAGKNIGTIAKQAGVSAKTSIPTSMIGGGDNAIPSEAADQAFSLKQGEVTTFYAPDRLTVLRLVSASHDNASGDTKEKMQMRISLSNSTASDIIAEYTKYLRTIFPVKIHKSVMDTLRSQGG